MEIIFVLEIYLATVLVRILQRNRTNRMYIFRKSCIIRIAHEITEADSPKIYRVSWQVGRAQESPQYKFRSESKTRRTNGVVPVQRPAGFRKS